MTKFKFNLRACLPPEAQDANITVPDEPLEVNYKKADGTKVRIGECVVDPETMEGTATIDERIFPMKTDMRLFEVSLVAESPNPEYGVYPIERVEDADG